MPDIIDLCAEIEGRAAAWAAKNANASPRYCPRASDIGECDREMTYSITHWRQRPAPERWLLERFRRGSEIETIANRKLLELGIPVIESQRTLEIRDRDGTLLCTAHMDGKLQWQSLTPVFECKSLNPNIWARINDIADFNRYVWARRYPRQLLLYMYATDEPFGLFLLDDCLGHWKLLPMVLEYHLPECERLLRRLRAVVDSAKSGAELPYIDNPVICKDCWAFKANLCQPPMDFSGMGLVTVDDWELAEAFATIKRTAEAFSDYDAAEELVKEHFKARGAGQYLVGDTHVTVVVRERKGGATATYTTWEWLDGPVVEPAESEKA